VIQALYCAANTNVKAGQICSKIDPRPYQTVVDQGNADLAAAEDRLEKDKTDLAHAKAAFERHEARRFERASWRSKRRAISRKALDNSRRAYAQAQTQTKLDEATVAELQAALHAAETNLGDTDIIAPIVGTIVSRKRQDRPDSRGGRRNAAALPHCGRSQRYASQWKGRRGCRRRNQARRQGFIHGRLFCRSSFAGEVMQSDVAGGDPESCDL